MVGSVAMKTVDSEETGGDLLVVVRGIPTRVWDTATLSGEDAVELRPAGGWVVGGG